jgi:hypothetical protein
LQNHILCTLFTNYPKGFEVSNITCIQLECSHLSKKIASSFLKASLFEEGISQARQAAHTFEPSRGSTNAVGRWITEPLHPAFPFT